MKKTFKFFAAALAIVAAASCAKEISNDNIQNETPTEDAVDKVFMTFDASIDTEETPDTKTTLNGKLVEWNEGDKITLYGTKSYNTGDGYNKHKGYCVIDPTTISDDKLRASFAGNVAASEDYCAFYPGDNWEADGMVDYKYIFSGFATQNAVKGSFDPSKHVMVARKLEDGCFNFKNVCALAKVTIGSEGVYSVKIEGQAWYSGTDYGSIGGAYGWKTSGSLFEYSPVTSNKIHSITLSNENGSELEVGATYYIVLPVCEIKGFTVSICNKSGAVLKSISKSSNFNVERNKIYDLGTFEFKEVPFLNVSTTNVSIPKKGGSVTINIDSNVDWNINNLAGSWLTVSKTSDNKGCVFTAQANKESSKRPSSSTNYVIISGGGINHIINVSQDYITYRIDGSALSRASDLTNGQMYVVRLHSDRTIYWFANTSELKTYKPSETSIPTQCVFVYKKDDSKATKSNYGKSYTSWFQTYYYGGQYSYMSAGGWQSKYNDKYLTHDLDLSNYLDDYFTHMNGWINNNQKNLNTSEDFDIYRDGGSDMLNCNGSSYTWGNNGTAQYKWTFYKVVEN